MFQKMCQLAGARLSSLTARVAEDDGIETIEVAIIAGVIAVAALAAAGLLSGKIQSWVGKVPG